MKSANVATIQISLNGTSHQVVAGKSLPDWIESLGLPLQGVLIEVNGRALLRSEWEDTQINSGDEVEILRVVAGG